MSIEEEIFKRRVFLPEQLIAYGFSREKGGYAFSKVFYDGFRAELFVSDGGTISGKVYDPEFSEEYVVFRMTGAEGAFVCGIKEAYLSLLSDICEKTTCERPYVSDQANEISEAFFIRFGAHPEFLWTKFPHYGVYRNAKTRKWFAIVMNLNARKVAEDAEARGLFGEIEVVNFNLGDRVAEFIAKGALPSYHMSKKNWVTVPLNGALSNDLVLEMAEISYHNSQKKKR